MTQSLPGQAPRVGRPEERPARRAGGHRAKTGILNAVTKATLRVIPYLPDGLKRTLLGRRSVTVDGNTLDTTLQLMLTAQRAAGVGGLVGSDDVATARAQLRSLAAMFDVGLPVDVSDLFIPGPVGTIRTRHYRPSTHNAGPLLVFFHGGGFVLGDLDTHDDLCRLICRDADIQVLSVDYRLAPEHKAPAAAEDAFAAYRWALEHAAEIGADPGRVAVGGDSAGANLAAVVAQCARDEDVQSPVLQVLLYPVTDLSSDRRSKTLFADGYFLTKRDMDWFRDNYLGDAQVDPSDPLVSPLLADDLSGLPPALVLTAGFDPLRDEGNEYADALRAAGVTVDLRQQRTLVHGFASFFPLGGDSATATAEMVSALRAHLSHGSRSAETPPVR